MLAQALCRGNGSPKESFLYIPVVSLEHEGGFEQPTMMFMVAEKESDMAAGHPIAFGASLPFYHHSPLAIPYHMDLLDIGAQCSHSSCNELDFLPIVCRCNRYYCRHHITPDMHSCPVDLAAENSNHSIPFQKLQRCVVETCGNPSLNAFNAHSGAASIPATCSQCQQSFCAS
jgi:hypothetical protein